MYILLITVHIIVSIVLIFVILLQSGRGSGLSETFASSSASTIFGTSAPTFLQRATSVCAIIFLLTSLGLTILSSQRSRSLMELERLKQVLPQAGQIPVKENALPLKEEGSIEEIPIEREPIEE